MLVAVSTVENVQKRQCSLCCVDFSEPGLRSFQMCVYFQRLTPSSLLANLRVFIAKRDIYVKVVKELDSTALSVRLHYLFININKH